MLDRLVDHLAYMSAENLATLAEVLMSAAQGPLRNVWPAEVTVRNLAHNLQAPPLRQRRIVTSWLASVEGPRALAGGYLVDLYRWLRDARVERPPLVMDMRVIREEAVQNMRWSGLVRDRIDRLVASPEDLAWIAEWRRDDQIARQIVAEGQRRRTEAREAGQA
jgi:hypothetical protein